MTKEEAEKIGVKEGDVFQLNEYFGPNRGGWIGCFILATEIKPQGIQGFVSIVETHEKQGRAFIRPKWEQIEYIGRAVLVPGPEPGEEGD